MTRTLIGLAIVLAVLAGCEQLKSPQRLKALEDRVDKLSSEVAAMKPGAAPVRPHGGSGSEQKMAGSGSGEGEGSGSDAEGKGSGSGEQVAAAEGSAHGEGAAPAEGSAVPAEGAHGGGSAAEGSAAEGKAAAEGSAAEGKAAAEGSAAEGKAAAGDGSAHGEGSAQEAHDEHAAPVDAGVPDASKADQALADLRKVVSDLTAPGKRGGARARDGKADAKTSEARTGEAKAGDARTGEARTGEAKAGDARTGEAKTSEAKAGDAKGKPAAQEPAPNGPARWSYDGKTGPAQWGALDPAWATCQKGKMQSPIDIEPRAGTAKPIEFHYQPTPATIIDNGHTLQVRFASGSSIEIDGRRYGLLQMQFHAPSEHTVAGERYPLELDLVHQDDDGHIAVIGLLYDAGAASRPLAGLWPRWPRKVGVEDKLKKPFDPGELLPESRRVYRYTGSLTSPPCTEGVVWSVMRRAMTDSRAALDGFARHYPNNAREVQPRGDRKIE